MTAFPDCGSASELSAGIVKIGIVNDQAGPLSDLAGPGSVVAAKMALDDFRKLSPELKVEIVVADHQNKPDIGAQIVRKWFDVDGVDMVADVGSYDEFLPWVVAVRVRSSSETETVADLVVGFNAFKERFTSRVVKERPERICVDYVEGPLKYLHNEWRFDRAGDGGTNVCFSVDFAFKSRLFETLAGSMFDRALRRMTNAFEQRAAVLYGISKSSAQSAA